MKNNIREEDIIFRYPSKEEIKAAQLACCGRCCDACETPAEYAWRKRGVDMAVLLEKAIETELSENERITVRERWYESMSVGEIATKQTEHTRKSCRTQYFSKCFFLQNVSFP